MKKLASWERPDRCEDRLAGRRTGGLPGQCLLLLLACCFTVTAQNIPQDDKSAPLPDLPEARSPVTLSAVNDPVTGESAFSFEGKEIPPVIRSAPGSKIQIEYLNKMSRNSKEV
jgi:hypothetical protein